MLREPVRLQHAGKTQPLIPAEIQRHPERVQILRQQILPLFVRHPARPADAPVFVVGHHPRPRRAAVIPLVQHHDHRRQDWIAYYQTFAVLIEDEFPFLRHKKAFFYPVGRDEPQPILRILPLAVLAPGKHEHINRPHRKKELVHRVRNRLPREIPNMRQHLPAGTVAHPPVAELHPKRFLLRRIELFPHQPLDQRSLLRAAAANEHQLHFIERPVPAGLPREVIVENRARIGGLRFAATHVLPCQPEHIRRQPERRVVMEVKPRERAVSWPISGGSAVSW